MLLNYGSAQLELTLPEDIPQKIISGCSCSPLEEPHDEILKVLRQPLGTLPLRQIVKTGETVSILVNDSTRLARSELFLPLLIEELEQAGIKKDDIFIVFTNGSHRHLSREEMIELVGNEVASKVNMFNHDCNEPAKLVFLGLTSRGTPVNANKMVVQADRRILTGSVVHHFFAGFGGGRKALIPGVAGWDTIQKNHSLLFDDQAKSGILEGNPVHEDLLEAALMVGADFLLNTVLNEQKEILGVFAGDMVKAHLQACAMVDEINGITLEKAADVVIASCGGYPKDINLYQAHKTLDNAIKAMKPGGQLILLAQCPEGIGSENYEKWASKYSALPELEKALRQQFELGGHKAYTVAKLLQRGEVYIVSDLPADKSRMLGFIPVSSLDEALQEIYRDKEDLLTYIFPQGSLCVPRLAEQ